VNLFSDLEQTLFYSKILNYFTLSNFNVRASGANWWDVNL